METHPSPSRFRLTMSVSQSVSQLVSFFPNWRYFCFSGLLALEITVSVYYQVATRLTASGMCSCAPFCGSGFACAQVSQRHRRRVPMPYTLKAPDQTTTFLAQRVLSNIFRGLRPPVGAFFPSHFLLPARCGSNMFFHPSALLHLKDFP